MTEPRTYPEGVPSWIDLEQPDLEATRRFYSALFGWSIPDDDRPYFVATLDGQDVAGLSAGESDRGWLSHIAVDDAETASIRVVQAGGTLLEAPEGGNPAGRSAICADPQGAVFGLWQAGFRIGAQAVNVPGGWNFSDLHTPDTDAALAFYAEVFGWQVDPDLGAGMIRLPGYGDHLASTADPDIHERQSFAPPGFADVVAGITPDDGPARWVIRFAVADRDATAALAERLGGTVSSSSEDEWTREADVTDPQGARFIVSQFMVS